MAEVVLAALRTVIEDDETYVSSALTYSATAIMPEISAGASDTVAVGYEIRLECTGGSPMIVETYEGRYVGSVPGYGQAVVVAEQGVAEGEKDFWRFVLLASPPATTIANVASTDSGAGGDDATFVTAINAIIAVLDGAGLTKVE